jgi:outer membrane receptor protein involved in Fe transport
MNFSASYTDGSSNTPDFKSVRYYRDASYNLSFPQSFRPDRYFRYLYEDLFDSYIGFELPVNERPGLTRKLSFGAAYQKSERNNEQYMYRLMGIEGQVTNNDISQHFDLNRFVIEDGKMQIYYDRPESPVDFGFGYNKTSGAYMLLDYSLNKRLRLAGGLRAEHTVIFADVQEFYDMNLPPYDSIRVAYSSFSAGGGGINVPALNASQIDQFHYLPSLNLVYKINNSELAPIQLRLNYSQNIARPSIREVSPFYMYDFSLRAYIVGNPELQVVTINNYDARLESYFNNGDNFSVSLFYKTFKNHIELMQGSYYTWKNADDSRVYGIEIEGKKTLSRNFDIMANITLVDSRTREKSTSETEAEYRPMFGQSPYVINAILSYITDRHGITSSISYNIQGPKLITLLEAGLPSIYEMPRHLLDFKISKKLGNRFGVTCKIRNILNAPIRRSYDYQDWTWDYLYYSAGTDYSLGINYSF